MKIGCRCVSPAGILGDPPPLGENEKQEQQEEKTETAPPVSDISVELSRHNFLFFCSGIHGGGEFPGGGA